MSERDQVPHIESHWVRLWEPRETRLFWYVLPPAAVDGSVRQLQLAVNDPAVWTSIPLDWIHVTLALTTAPLDAGPAMLKRAQAAVAGMSSFLVTPTITVWSEAVVFQADGDGWETLRSAVLDASEPHARRPDHFIPHMSTNYAHGPGDADVVRDRIRAADIAPMLPWLVDSAWLLAVQQKPGPQFGWYDWTPVGEVRLGEPAL